MDVLRGTKFAIPWGMRHSQVRATKGDGGILSTPVESAMGTVRAGPAFIYLVLVAATLLAALELAFARPGGPPAQPTAPWLSRADAVGRAITRAGLTSAVGAQSEAYQTAVAADAAWREGTLECEASASRHRSPHSRSSSASAPSASSARICPYPATSSAC